MHLPTRDDVRKAYQRIHEQVIRTPLVHSEALSTLSNAQVYLKLETMQKTGAFKYRGALNFVSAQSQPCKGVVAASSGNHALGIALACKNRGLLATVVMPVTSPLIKQAKARSYGARVILHGKVYDEAKDHAEKLAKQNGLLFAPSFDHSLIIAGQGTIGWELQEQIPQADTILMPVGGGGLLAGLMLAYPPPMPFVGVQAQGAASMVSSLQTNEIQSLKGADTIADGIATLRPGVLNFQLVKNHQGEVVVVRDEEIKQGMTLLLGEGIVAEPAAAAPVAALLGGKVAVRGKTVVLIITGRNVSAPLLEETAKEWAREQASSLESYPC